MRPQAFVGRGYVFPGLFHISLLLDMGQKSQGVRGIGRLSPVGIMGAALMAEADRPEILLSMAHSFFASIEEDTNNSRNRVVDEINQQADDICRHPYDQGVIKMN